MRRTLGSVAGRTAAARTAITVVVVATVLVAGGCGASSDDPGQIVRAAATKTAAAESSRIALDIDVSGAQSAKVTASGAFDYGSRRGTLTMDLSSVPGAAGMGTVDAVVDGSVIYLEFPPQIAAQIPGGKSWVKIDVEAAGRQAGLDVSQLGGLEQSDPTQALQYLRGASDDVTDVGREDVRGVATTHYRGTLDLREAGKGLSGAAKAAYDAALEKLGRTTLPADVWVDEQGRARKMTFTQDVSKASGGRAGATTVTMELFDFGVAVDAEPPPADQVFDLSSLTGGAG